MSHLAVALTLCNSIHDVDTAAAPHKTLYSHPTNAMFSVIRARLALSKARPRTSHASAPPITIMSRGKHTTDSYTKDVDSTPPHDSAVHRVDPDSDRVQKPYEPPSGEWSRAGVETEEYRHAKGAKKPHAPKGGDKGRPKSRQNWAEGKGSQTSGKAKSSDA